MRKLKILKHVTVLQVKRSILKAKKSSADFEMCRTWGAHSNILNVEMEKVRLVRLPFHSDKSKSHKLVRYQPWKQCINRPENAEAMKVNAHHWGKNCHVTIITKLSCWWKLACTIAWETMIFIIVSFHANRRIRLLASIWQQFQKIHSSKSLSQMD